MKPCPFCGEALVPGYTGSRGKSIYWTHPLNTDPRTACYYSGATIGIERKEKWDTRAEGTLFMEITQDGAEGYPQFNNEGRGKPVELAMINATILYYRRKALEKGSNV